MTDFTYTNHGTLCLLTPLTPEAEEWIADNLPEDVMTLGPSVAIEPRYLEAILDGIENDGLICE